MLKNQNQNQNQNENRPELLLPAGNLTKLKIAVQYGADAVYLGGEKFGLRTRADNFTLDELRDGVSFAHERNVKVYVTLNGFLHDQDLEDLPEFVAFLENVGVDAVIVSDVGVISLIRSVAPKLPIHLSTQASCLNAGAASIWKELGVERIVLGREVSMEGAALIKQKSGVAVEIFIHGSMCMAYSGHCTISNFTAGRNSNRGGCAHSCRFRYQLQEESKSYDAYFMSSKDLNGIDLIGKAKELGIDSLKVEGRMKSELYVATVGRAYRQALDGVVVGGEELNKIPHREYGPGNLSHPAGRDSILFDKEKEIDEFCVVGSIVEIVSPDYMLLEVRNCFVVGEKLEILSPKGYEQGQGQSIVIERIENILGELSSKSKPNTLVKLPYVTGVCVGDLVRKQITQVTEGV